ncbi:Uma2 family endonuclease [Desulfovirgula thermocuniculi]|uniref:Uma2 family endonuclease n=1 Tax=Desulfovirgula thermocuniculi TaxID=348842 RepID=UPI00048909C0|nr:Uma2 family endonuclease [Desulfovirgula thermocuniculi]
MAWARPQIKFTYEDYCLLPEEKRVELIGGDFYLVPSPSVFHQRVAANIEDILRRFVKERKLGEVFLAPLDVVLSPHDVVQPDIMFISRERLHLIDEENIKGPPDLVVEVLSPPTAERDRTLKKKLYAKSGVRELWLVDVAAQVVEVFDLEACEDASPAVYARGEGRKLLSGVLPGLEVSLDEVF